MMNLTSELEDLVQSRLSAAEANIISYQQITSPKSLEIKRLLVLLEKNFTNALVILSTSESLPQSTSDFKVDEILPIERGFECTVERAEEFRHFSDIFLKVTCRRSQTLFQMLPNRRTTDLISYILQSIDAFQQRMSNASNFAWISRIPGQVPSIDPVIRYRMTRRSNMYTNTKNLRILVGTYNVNSRSPADTSDLDGWLRVNETPAPDVIAIGLQELDRSKNSLLFNETEREDIWRELLLDSLKRRQDGSSYRLLARERLAWLAIFVFVKTEHLDNVRDVCTTDVGAGIMKVLGNKGGVAVSFIIYETSMCFVNSHLAAHLDEYTRRNQDYACISINIEFENNPTKTLIYHDQVYWMGDLNYRIADMDTEDIKRLADAGEYENLLKWDQLNTERKFGRVFSGYQEAEIKFKPTYKYDPDTDDWDSSKKQRAPAWCDRILWRGDGVRVRDYRSHPELMISDHKPVSATFDSSVKVINKFKWQQVYEDVVYKTKYEYFLPRDVLEELETGFEILSLNTRL